MKLITLITFLLTFTLLFSLFSFVTKPVNAATGCGFNPLSVVAGENLGLALFDFPNGNYVAKITSADNTHLLGNISVAENPTQAFLKIPTEASIDSPKTYEVKVETGFGPGADITCGAGALLTVNPPSDPDSEGGGADLGTITPPIGVPTTDGDPSNFIGNAVKAVINLLIIVAFLIALFWTIFAGIRFITSAGDPKATGAAWSSIYWGLIGMVVVLGSFAIINLVEIFFGVKILSNGFSLPQI